MIAFGILLVSRRAASHARGMSSWSEFENEAPDLERRVRERLDAHTHKTIATLRRDGSPRISGTEMRFADGELWIGSMWEARKALDLRRDPRYALHSGSDDPPGWVGDAKVAGLAEEITDPERVLALNGSEVGRSHLFRLDLSEASLVALGEDEKSIVIESWKPGEEVKTLRRA